MKQRTVEAVELARTEHRKDITRLDEDRQHFVGAFADSMNEVTRLRTKHLDYGEWEMMMDTMLTTKNTMI